MIFYQLATLIANWSFFIQIEPPLTRNQLFAALVQITYSSYLLLRKLESVIF